MGQLEKYGLYVLCLLIFLILGVTLWGSGEVAARENGSRNRANHLNATAEKTGGATVGNASVRGEGRSTASLPDFRALLRPNAVPEDPVVAPRNDGAGGQTPASVAMDDGAASVAERRPGDSRESVASSPAAERSSHVIKSGDNFESIALQYFGDRLLRVEIARLNPRLDPRRLQLGKVVLLPTESEVEKFQAKRNRSRKVAAGNRYTIVRGDTFEGIAVRELGSRKRTGEIRQLNPGVDPSSLKIGSTIRLPRK